MSQAEKVGCACNANDSIIIFELMLYLGHILTIIVTCGLACCYMNISWQACSADVTMHKEGNSTIDLKQESRRTWHGTAGTAVSTVATRLF